MKNPTAYGFALLLLVQAMSAALYVVPNEEKQEEWQASVFESSARSNNSSSPCGSNANYSYTYAYAPYMVMENQSFTTSSYVYCEILNATMMLDYSIIDSSNSTVYSGNYSWTGSNTSSSNYTWNVSGLSAGYYTFNAELYVDGTSVDNDYDSFMVYANNSGGGGSGSGNYTSPCGDNVSDVWFEVSPYQEEWNASDTVSVYLDTYCGIWNNSYMVSWGLIDNANNSTIGYGSTSFMTTPSSVSYHINHTYHFNEVDIHLHYMEPGNYTVFGHFSVLVNNSWTLLSNQSSTFVVNSTMTTTVCGFNSTFIDLETGLQSTTYSAGSSVHPYSDIECPMLNTMYTYTWEMYNLNTSTITHSGLQNFTATWQNVNMFTDGSGFYYDLYPHAYNLTEGTYLLNTTLLSASGELIDASLVSFTVLANPGNNTGGNNTGGNTTSDTDGDGVPDSLDAFPLDSSEAFDNDGDGVGDNADMDDDNDGVSDQEDAFPFDGGASNDADADGVADAYDNCITVFNPNQADADLDGIGTECDADESTGNSGNNTGGEAGGNNTGGETGGNNTGGETGGNNTGGETGGNNTDTSNWTECEVWEYFNQELIEETEPGNGCPFYEDTSEEDGAEEDTEGLPSVGFFATLTVVGLAIAFARREKE